jgi:hypothetical protein
MTTMEEINLSESDRQTIWALQNILHLHARALACHCECLGMNAENAIAVCDNYTPPYNEAAYTDTMKKWNLVDNDGNPSI